MKSNGDSSLEINNISLVEELYDRYKNAPDSLSSSWKNYFQQLDSAQLPSYLSSKPLLPTATPFLDDKSSFLHKETKIEQLITAYRTYGHLWAVINSITLKTPNQPPQLVLSQLGFTEQELDEIFPTHGLLSKSHASLSEIIEILKNIYCGHFSTELTHLRNSEMRLWIEHEVESTFFDPPLPVSTKEIIWRQLVETELFEEFLHTKFVGQKRFSLEGGETLIPIIASILDSAADANIEELILGMAHRGRLDILTQILQKPYKEIFNEFDEDYIFESFEGTGDVKYHKGYASEPILSENNKKMKITLVPNPSHLEFVNPVVEGLTRAKQMNSEGNLNFNKALPLLIHGDAAISGQGVVYETLQLVHLDGYTTGGTLHIVINNQIGFTTLPKDSRSTPYCTDIARSFDAPVFHLNGEDPERCIWAALLALKIRQKFHCDVFLDLNCYRKYGHNEGDEPAFTQPLEYQIIRGRRSISQLYETQLIREGIITEERALTTRQNIKTEFQTNFEKAQNEPKPLVADLMTRPAKKAPFKELAIKTSVPKKIIEELALKFCEIPSDFQLHQKLKGLLKDRIQMSKGEKPFDWGMGEMLAYASLLNEGHPIRLSGQDCCRGTFSHRHAIWVDQKREVSYFSLAHLKEDQGHFEAINSPLSETAVLGFEYGYSLLIKGGLTIWEAQFGDFSNGAQVIIDQFIASGEQKWGQKSALTLFLPHGYEGQGPEHSSARLERFLALAGHDNIQITYPSTPAQLFHLLRRQTLQSLIKPLVIFTPKGLLRHPLCISSLEEFSEGHFSELIADSPLFFNAPRLVFCTGKIYYDLLTERKRGEFKTVAFIRIEQLYPLNIEKLKEFMSLYKEAKEYLWVQEEPENMGAWLYIRSFLEKILPSGSSLQFIGREASASPATGSHLYHKQEVKRIINQVFQA